MTGAGVDLALGSARVLHPDGDLRPGVVLVRDGRVADIVAPADAPAGWEDLGELVVLPGLVDTHVHVDDPGRAHWEGFDAATRAAALGGVTTLVDMPLNCLPPTVSVDALDAKLAAAEGRLHVDVAFWGGIVPGSEDELEPLADAGVLGFKVFLCDSGVPEYGSFGADEVPRLLARTARLGLPLIVHAEDPGALRDPPAGADSRAYRTWLDSRPPEAEVRAVAALVEAARATGGHVHVLHLSAAGAGDLVREARREGVPITAETCPHYLTIAAEDVPDGATDYKCAPPIRERANQEQLWEALADGTIDAVVSDHSPCPPEDKRLDTGDFTAAWGGIASLQLGPALVWTAARRRGHDLADVARWTAAGPARVAGLAHKGRLAPGADADLVVVDPEAAWTVEPSALAHRHPVTPYGGRTLTGAVLRTYLRGRCIVRDGELTAAATGRPRRRGEG
jgi:allantoinase